MKVLHLISGGDRGGAKTHIMSLVKGLNKSIHTKIICFIKGDFYDQALDEGINIEVYEQRHRMDMFVINKLAGGINSENYDLVHCHGARANFIAMLLKRKIKQPIITTIHSDYKLDFTDNLYKRILYTKLNTIALNGFDYYIAISDYFKEMLISRGFQEDKIYVSYNGLDFSLDYQYNKEEFFRKYNIKEKYSLIVGIMARLDSVKNHETFILAASKVLEKKKDILFLIGGKGKEEERLKELVSNFGIKDNVKFLGFIKEPYSFYNIIDINTLTSLSESFPYVILEGALLKKPIISTNVGGISRLIKDGHNGYLFDTKDADYLSNKILDLYARRDHLLTLGKNLYKDVKNNYSCESMAERHLQIYNEILRRVEHG